MCSSREESLKLLPSPLEILQHGRERLCHLLAQAVERAHDALGIVGESLFDALRRLVQGFGDVFANVHEKELEIVECVFDGLDA